MNYNQGHTNTKPNEKGNKELKKMKSGAMHDFTAIDYRNKLPGKMKTKSSAMPDSKTIDYRN